MPPIFEDRKEGQPPCDVGPHHKGADPLGEKLHRLFLHDDILYLFDLLL